MKMFLWRLKKWLYKVKKHSEVKEPETFEEWEEQQW
jgi:hypothetical protein